MIKAANPQTRMPQSKVSLTPWARRWIRTRLHRLSRRVLAGSIPDEKIEQGLYNSITENDYDGVIISLVKRYCPPGLLGLALTALLASFMSGMAGNVTAFNTVWTYDLYQAYLAPNRSDHPLFLDGQVHHRRRHRLEYCLPRISHRCTTMRWTSSNWYSDS